MRSLKEINEEIKITPETDEKRQTFLNTIRLYLETNPSEAYLKKEAERLQNIIKSIRAGFDTYCKCNPDVSTDSSKEEIAVARAAYYRSKEYTKHRRHLKTTLYILNN